MRLVRSALGPGAVSIDVGANIGVLSVAMALASPDGTVIALEPSPSSFVHLRANTADLPVTAIQAGVSDHVGEMQLHTDPLHPGGAFLSEDDSWIEPSVTVPITTLDQLVTDLGLSRLDFVKVDVEGHELAVLGGAVEVLRRFRPVIAVECNPVTLRRFAGRRAVDLFDALADIYGEPPGLLNEAGSVDQIGHIDILRSELDAQGIVDLVAGAQWRSHLGLPFVTRVERMRRVAARNVKRILYQRRGRAPGQTLNRFAQEPGVIVMSRTTALSVVAGASISVDVEFVNGPYWLSSTAMPHPITIGHRWYLGDRLAHDDGKRTLIDPPIPPGAKASMTCLITAPAVPGRYVLKIGGSKSASRGSRTSNRARVLRST